MAGLVLDVEGGDDGQAVTQGEEAVGDLGEVGCAFGLVELGILLVLPGDGRAVHDGGQHRRGRR